MFPDGERMFSDAEYTFIIGEHTFSDAEYKMSAHIMTVAQACGRGCQACVTRWMAAVTVREVLRAEKGVAVDGMEEKVA